MYVPKKLSRNRYLKKSADGGRWRGGGDLAGAGGGVGYPEDCSMVK